MKNLVIAALAGGIVAGCQTTSSATGPAAAPPPQETRQPIRNIAHFDIGTCFAAPPELSAPMTKEQVLAVQLSARPLVMECLVDPASRAEGPKTQVNLTSAWTDGAMTHRVTGENLTADGERCVVEALEKYTQALILKPTEGHPGPAGGASPVENAFSYAHDVNRDVAVKLGINELSDLVASIRLAMPGWCDCYQPVQAQVPPSFLTQVVTTQRKAAEGKAAEVDVAVEVDPKAPPSGVPGPVVECLLGKVRQHPLPVRSAKNVFPYAFIHTNFEARSDEAITDPLLRLDQLELERTQRLADRLAAYASVNAAAASYQHLVNQYRAKPASVKRPQLQARCAAMVSGDEAYLKVLRELKAVADLQVSIVQGIRAKDASYPEAVEAHTLKAQSEAAENLKAAEETLKSDQGICARLLK